MIKIDFKEWKYVADGWELTEKKVEKLSIGEKEMQEALKDVGDSNNSSVFDFLNAPLNEEEDDLP